MPATQSPLPVDYGASDPRPARPRVSGAPASFSGPLSRIGYRIRQAEHAVAPRPQLIPFRHRATRGISLAVAASVGLRLDRPETLEPSLTLGLTPRELRPGPDDGPVSRRRRLGVFLREGVLPQQPRPHERTSQRCRGSHVFTGGTGIDDLNRCLHDHELLAIRATHSHWR